MLPSSWLGAEPGREAADVRESEQRCAGETEQRSKAMARGELAMARCVPAIVRIGEAAERKASPGRRDGTGGISQTRVRRLRCMR